MKLNESSIPSIAHVTTHSGIGGAGKAAQRIVEAQWDLGMKSDLHCLASHDTAPGIRVYSPPEYKARLHLAKQLLELARTGTVKSFQNKATGLFLKLKKSDYSLIHLHWINGALSFYDIAQFDCPLVWTLHDMWPFCGEEHYTESLDWCNGYFDRPISDVNRISWEEKKRQWNRPIHLVAPSHWMADCVMKSALMRDWPLTIIPHPIDTDKWVGINQQEAREKLNLQSEKMYFLYGASAGVQDRRKGFDLLYEALLKLGHLYQNVELLVFGEPIVFQDQRLPIHYVGVVKEERMLRELYSAADLLLVPSRQECFGLVAQEALSCGLPVVAFRQTGVAEIVEQGITGYLAEFGSAEDFARGINWGIGQLKRDRNRLSKDCRERAVAKFSQKRIANLYLELYELVLSRSC